jgi:hypothetical protein
MIFVNNVKSNVPRKVEALTGVDVLGWTLANQAGATLDRPITHMYRAWPSIATNSDVRIPKLAPAPITFDTHPNPFVFPLNAAENGASASICVVTHTDDQQ